jgi:hypothetical protein
MLGEYSSRRATQGVKAVQLYLANIDRQNPKPSGQHGKLF